LLGGLHLTGRIFEPIIPPTIAELKAIAPHLIMPGHCTGWKATHQLARELSEAYIPSSVGTRLVINGGTGS
jgi:7,8-dihydropterin-6-yl-methyl-4-(beta-D-ribofuranosyl)aminobenzene 5'-phosphate synthase